MSYYMYILSGDIRQPVCAVLSVIIVVALKECGSDITRHDIVFGILWNRPRSVVENMLFIII